MPIALARGGHAYTAKVARETADIGYCASKKLFFHGVKLHAIARRRSGQVPLPQQVWLREASCNDLRSVKEQEIELPTTTLFGDKAYADAAFAAGAGSARYSSQNAAEKTQRSGTVRRGKSTTIVASTACVNPSRACSAWLQKKTRTSRGGYRSLRRRSQNPLLGQTHCGLLNFTFEPLIHIDCYRSLYRTVEINIIMEIENERASPKNLSLRVSQRSSAHLVPALSLHMHFCNAAEC